MKAVRYVMLAVCLCLLADQIGRADDRYDADEIVRYQDAMERVIAGTSIATDCFAAIAYSRSTGNWGYSYNYPTLDGARRRALAQCKGSDARVVIWAKNRYCALAVGKNGSGWATGVTAAQAGMKALAECGKQTTNCRILTCVYSGR
jgi:hypothetical protein